MSKKIAFYHSILLLVCLVIMPVFSNGCAQQSGVLLMDSVTEEAKWKRIVHDRVSVFGHRNWIVVADAAYPSHSSNGIETILTHGDQIEVLRAVLHEIDQAKHLHANIYTDTELKYVTDRDARGMDDYRQRLSNVLSNRSGGSMLHEEIISRLDKTSEKFNVLILKTNLMVPYTSVFIDLGCGYWSADSEKKLRAAMSQQGGK